MVMQHICSSIPVGLCRAAHSLRANILSSAAIIVMHFVLQICGRHTGIIAWRKLHWLAYWRLGHLYLCHLADCMLGPSAIWLLAVFRQTCLQISTVWRLAVSSRERLVYSLRTPREIVIGETYYSVRASQSEGTKCRTSHSR